MTKDKNFSRRDFISFFTGLGIGSTIFPIALWAESGEGNDIDVDNVKAAEKLAGLKFTDKERLSVINGLKHYLENYQTLRKIEVANHVPPAWQFYPMPTNKTQTNVLEKIKLSLPKVELPKSKSDIAFLPLTALAYLISTKQLTSLELTQIYLERLSQYNPPLKCIITLVKEESLEQAQQADIEITQGNYRGPLHGIPYGLKDLFATSKYTTTWGARPYKNQKMNEDATVVKCLQKAGAILVAKLSLGALAMGDVWFGGTTRNPWDIKQGSSGSSAGSAAAVAAGLVGFAIGTETWGSIVSPCTRCGATGLRPTFGRVSRHGAMALSWTMDKIGPIARSVEDCALILQAIHGPDGKDRTVSEKPFHWPVAIDTKKLKVGYLHSAFIRPRKDNKWRTLDLQVLKTIGNLGHKLHPIELPDYPINSLSFILLAEAAASFDELTRSNRDDLLVRQDEGAWPNIFRKSQFISAVEYIRANRIRTIVMEEMEKIMETVDVYVCPSYGDNLLLTNLTGHPCVVVPNGFVHSTPRSISFIGKLFEEEKAIALAKEYQQATDFHKQHPKKFS